MFPRLLWLDIDTKRYLYRILSMNGTTISILCKAKLPAPSLGRPSEHEEDQDSKNWYERVELYLEDVLQVELYFRRTVYLFARQVRVIVSDPGLCCCVCVMSFKSKWTPLFVDWELQLIKVIIDQSLKDTSWRLSGKMNRKVFVVKNDSVVSEKVKTDKTI